MNDRLSDGLSSVQSQLAGLLAAWTQSQRLYTVSGSGPVNDLMVEQFTLIDNVSEPFTLQLIVLTLDAYLPLHTLDGQRITLSTRLSDGSLHQRSGFIAGAADLGSDGGFKRLQLTIRPWIASLTHGSHSRAWQQKTVPQILDDVFSAYSRYATWRFGEVAADGSAESLDTFLSQGPNAGVLDYCCQYRETDLAFTQRLLASVGLGWRIEESEDAPCGHTLVVFADSSRWPENTTSASAIGGQGIKFQRSAATEEQDSIQLFGSQRSLNPAATAVLQWDYHQKKSVAVMVPTHHTFGAQPVQDMAAWLENYQTQGVGADGGSCTTAQLQHLATLGQQAHEFRNKSWLARSSVRSLRAGQWFKLKNSPLDALADFDHTDADLEFSVHSVHALGINNLPRELSDALAQAIANAPPAWVDVFADTSKPDPVAELLESLAHDPELSEQAAETGYANRFEACRRAIPWRPLYVKKPTARGSQTAIVVGPTGNTTPNGADELYTDRLGRIKVQFHWQSAPHADPRPDNRSSCWVRVAQRWSLPGGGHQFIPRIGMEVIIQFLNNDIDRPICIDAIYNGRGEGGLARTPGGAPGKTDTSVFSHSSDHRPSGQGNLTGGNSPAWHGGAPGPATPGAHAQNNAAALSGLKSKEFGGPGHNQLVFDDTPGQLRVQFSTTYEATQLNLGWLVHQADNHRGSFRGAGFELRTDAYGAIRGKQGLLITSYGTSPSDPAGDNAAGMALLKQAVQLADSMSLTARMHQTTELASSVGTVKAGQSHLSDKLAPLKALLQAASGMVSQTGFDGALNDAGNKSTQATHGKLPHSTDPIVAITAKAGLGIVAGQDIQFASGEAISWQAGQDIHIASGNQMRVNTGQSIGILAGAVQPGEGAKGKGLTMIAGQGPVDMQAQAGEAEVAAKGLINIQSVVGAVEWAAAKKITLQTLGGAKLVISAEGVVPSCPGKMTVHAAQKSFIGPGSESYPLPVMPVSVIAPEPDRQLQSAFAFDQLTLVAKKFTKLEFVALLVPIFGYDIPAHTYIKLYDGLRTDSIAQPKITVMNGSHHPASFDNKTREILVHRAAADRAAKGQDESWELLTALLHEFGHYIDLVLRDDLAEKNADGTSTLAADAQGDEGAKFAYEIAFFDFAGSHESVYATYNSPEFSGALKVNYNAARKAIRLAQGEEAQREEGKQGTKELFGAGLGEHHKERPTESFGHRSIELALLESSDEFAKRKALPQIYFGNWLRDFSQVLDPAIVRKPSAPKDFPRTISRDQLTELVDLLAELEFVERPADKALFKVTQQLLGVYRPVEHIDNPTNNDLNTIDPQSIDADFQPRATKDYVAVDPGTSMKRYISYSADYMRGELNKAVAAGPTAEGYRHFGAALHVLEDYFAHSNFVELSLRKAGHTKVLPWTSPVPGKHPLPVVTGMFDSDDVIASTAGLIADTVFKVQWEFQASKPGERTKADRIMLILLSEHSDPRMLESFKSYLLWRDKWASVPGHKYVEGAMHYTFGMVGNAYNFVYGSLIHLVGNSVDDQQVVRMGDPNTNGSTDPTHSQLAKDHDNHPFHTLAASLAKEAVRKVGRAMAARWWAADFTADPASVATAYLVHPFDSTWQDAFVANWAHTHPAQVKRGESATEWEALEKAHKQEAVDAINKVGKRSNEIWDYLNKNYEDLFGGKNQVKK